MSYHNGTPQAFPSRGHHFFHTFSTSRAAYLAGFRLPHLATRALIVIAEMSIKHGSCQARQAVMGRWFLRTDRQVRRAIRELKERGYITVKQRGKRISNVMRLAKWLWQRLTFRPMPKWTPPEQMNLDYEQRMIERRELLKEQARSLGVSV